MLYDTTQASYPTMPPTHSLISSVVFFFHVVCQINIHIDLLGATFFTPLQASTHPLASPRQVRNVNTPEPKSQARQTLKTHRTHINTRLPLISFGKEENSRQP